MVTITNYFVRETKDGRRFIALELTGGLELVLSPVTGKHYATVRKCSIPSTFDEALATKILGSQLPGEIVRVESEPYEYVKKSTGETMLLNYNYAYQTPDQAAPIGHTPVTEMQTA